MRLFASSLVPSSDVNSKGYINSVVSQSLLTIQNANINIDVNDFSGATDSDKIDNALIFAQQNKNTTINFTYNIGGGSSYWMLDKAVEIPNNTLIKIDGVNLKLNVGIFDNIIRSNGIVSDPIDPGEKAISIAANHDIHIIGVNNGSIEGSGSPVYGWGDQWGWRQVGLLFANTTIYSVTGLLVTDTHAWGISNYFNSKYAVFKNVMLNQHYKNGDGINIRKSCSHVIIEGSGGTTSDDLTALTTMLNNIEDSTYYHYPMHPEGNASYENGTYDATGSDYNDISYIYISRIGPDIIRTPRVVMILIAYGTKQHHIYIEDINVNALDMYFPYMIYIYTGYGTASPQGSFTNFHLKDLTLYNDNTSEIGDYVTLNNYNIGLEKSTLKNIYGPRPILLKDALSYEDTVFTNIDCGITYAQ